MSTRTPAVPGQYLLQFLDSGLLPEHAQQHITALMQRLAVDHATLSQPDTMVPTAMLEQFIRHSEIPDPLLAALDFGEQIRVTSQGDISVLLMTVNTVHELLAMTRFVPLLTNAAHLSVSHDHDTIHLNVQVDSGTTFMDELLLVYVMSAIPRLVTLLTGSTPQVQRHLTLTATTALLAHPTMQSSDWHFGAKANYLTFNAEVLATPILFADATMQTHVRQAWEERLALHQRQADVLTRVKRCLSEQQPMPNQNDVADHLNMSVSSLKRHLSQAGTHFADVQQGVREHKARLWLSQQQYSLPDIAEKLGYSEQSNFSHAFKKWTGSSPAAFRRAHSLARQPNHSDPHNGAKWPCADDDNNKDSPR